MPTVSITVPRSIAAAERKLNELAEIATATEWSRAAIVATYVNPGAGQGRRTSRSSAGGLESASAFARRGIVGLRSENTVLIYARAWLDRFDRPVPGRRLSVTIEEDWPPTRTGTDGYDTEEGAARTIDRIIERHGADVVAARVAETQPETIAKVVVDSPEADAAVTCERIDRVTTPEQRRELTEHNREMRERGDAADANMKTGLEHRGLVHHEATLDVRSARMWMRKAVTEYERNPLMTDEQREETEAALIEIEHLISLLRGQTGEWTDTDRTFLATLGIEDGEVTR